MIPVKTCPTDSDVAVGQALVLPTGVVIADSVADVASLQAIATVANVIGK